MILSFLSASLSGETLKIGAPAPSVITKDHEGEKVDLGAKLTDGTALVFFYPKAMTPGCTKQACSLRDGYEELTARGIAIYGVSSDTAETQAEFRNRHDLPFTLIADTDLKVAKAFGKGRWSRHAYLFVDGTLVWSDLSASTSEQAADVLKALDTFQKS
ncbi:MAG: peroxiredoxin [Verrucomicrobiota bacterium]